MNNKFYWINATKTEGKTIITHSPKFCWDKKELKEIINFFKSKGYQKIEVTTYKKERVDNRGD